MTHLPYMTWTLVPLRITLTTFPLIHIPDVALLFLQYLLSFYQLRILFIIYTLSIVYIPLVKCNLYKERGFYSYNYAQQAIYKYLLSEVSLILVIHCLYVLKNQQVNINSLVLHIVPQAQKSTESIINVKQCTFTFYIKVHVYF